MTQEGRNPQRKALEQRRSEIEGLANMYALNGLVVPAELGREYHEVQRALDVTEATTSDPQDHQ